MQTISNQIDIKRIQNCIVSLSEYSEKEITDLKEIDTALWKKVKELCISMFALRKMQNSSFHSFNASELKNISLNEENSFSEMDTIKLDDFFGKHFLLFHKLVSECFIKKPPKFENTVINNIFFVSFQSPYNSKKIQLFLVRTEDGFHTLDSQFKIKQDLFVFLLECGISKEKIDSLDFKELLKERDNYCLLEEHLRKVFNKLSVTVSANHGEFIEGAISFFDFLGWKGLWQNDNNDPLSTVSKLIDSFRVELTNITKQYFSHTPANDISDLISISDTIAVFTPKVFDVSKYQLLEIHAKIAKYILEKSCEQSFPIRGAISYGKYSTMNSIMVGPGIDECASWHEKSDWIGVHLTPSAQFIVDTGAEPNNIIKYNKIPLKPGIPKVDFCVHWTITPESFDNLINKVQAILPEIAAKYLNTYHFLFQEEGGENYGKKHTNGHC